MSDNTSSLNTNLRNIQEQIPNKDVSNEDGYKSFFTGNDSGNVNGYEHLAKASANILQNIVTFNYLNVTNEILKIIDESLSSLVPSGDSIADAERLQNSILLRLDALAADPEFQEKWKELSKSLAELLNTMINEMLDLVEEEGDEAINRFGKIANKMLTNMAATGVDIAQDALSVIPGVDAIVALFNLFTSAITNGSNSMVAALTLFSTAMQFSERFANITLKEDSKVHDIIKQVNEFIELIKTPTLDTNMIADKLATKLDERANIPDVESAVSQPIKQESTPKSETIPSVPTQTKTKTSEKLKGGTRKSRKGKHNKKTRKNH